MAFERLQRLGDEKFSKILNLLMRGEPAQRLAKEIQAPPPKGWGEFQDVAAKTLTQQLNRLRLAAAEGAFGLKTARRIAAGATPQIKRLERVSVPVLDRLEELSEAQRTLVMTLLAKATEEKRTFHSVNEAVEEYRKVLQDLQKIRFDLGLDEFKGPVGTTTVRGASQIITTPDGMSVQKQIFEAVTTIEAIFTARGIPEIEGGR